MNKEHDILKWFEGELSLSEIKKRYPTEDFSTLEKLHFYSKQINVPKINAEQALENFKKQSLKKQPTKVISLRYKAILKVAAVVAILLTSAYWLFFNNTQSYTTHIAQNQTLTLPDNSEVILNAESELTYNKKKWNKSRNLNLAGEAFFKVTKGKKFTVHTPAGNIQVLGTQFNVKQRNNYFEVQCYKGRVQVTYKDQKEVLTPGKLFRMINNKDGVVTSFKAKNPSWLFNESSFNNVPLWQVINELEIQYDIKIDASKVDTEQLFSGAFTHANKNMALESVTIPLKLSYKIKGKSVTFYNYGSN
ncbi:FecR family protein [Tenacibaculum sp. UWU-22]|uniref:FecR family protein n=1 Tax=Tenacibaculum sp. UWU-22 TaxID=3234187 RepID=UPI0034DB4528